MEEPSAAHFLEKFAFAEDRKLVLKELIPGTKEFYFYHGLVALQEGDVEAAKALWADFTSKDPLGSDHEPMQELLCRLRISQWGQSDEDTRACVDYLLKELKLNLDHQQHTVSGRTILDKNLDLPSSLAPDQASAKSLLSDPSLELTQAGCTWAMRENRPLLLKNLHNVTRPIPGIEALPEVYSVDFGSLPVHTQLTLHQLDKILEMNPDHGRGMVFLRCYTGKCAPSPDVLADVDNDELARYYDRLEPLTKHSAHLRALVLLGRMKIGRRCGRYDPALLRKYLEIPKCDGEAYMGRMADTMNGAVRISSNPFQVISPDNIPEASIVHEYFDANFRQLGGAGVLPPAQTHRLPPGADVAARAAAVSAAVRAELQPWEDLVRAGLLDYKFLLGVLAEAKLTSGGDVEL